MTALLLHGLVESGVPTDGSSLRLDAGEFAGLCSPVPAALSDARDPAATVAAAMAHDALLRAQSRLGDVLPVRFGSVFGSPAAVRADIAARTDACRAALSRISGAREFRLRIDWQRDPPAPSPSSADGRSFLRQRSARQERRSEARRAALGLAAELAGAAVATAREHRRGAASAGRLIDLDLLVPLDAMDLLYARIAEAAPKAAALGLSMALGGPHPAYSFCGTEPVDA